MHQYGSGVHKWNLCICLHREILKSFKGSDEAKLKTEQESRRLKNYLAQLKADHTAGATTGRSGYFRFLRQVIKSMPSFAPLPDKRAVHFVSAELCDYWNCGLPYVKSHDNKLIELISFEGELALLSLHE